jgi:hypothetical protein
MPTLPPEVLGPFHPDALAKTVAGPFGPGVRPGDPVIEDKPMLQSMGVTPDALKAMMDSYPDAKEALTTPEADALRTYLQGNRNYDSYVLNNLFAELSDGFRTRQALRSQAPIIKPMRFDSMTPRWALEAGDQSVAPTATRGPVPDVGYTEEGEAANPAPSEWWLSGRNE